MQLGVTKVELTAHACAQQEDRPGRASALGDKPSMEEHVPLGLQILGRDRGAYGIAHCSAGERQLSAHTSTVEADGASGMRRAEDGPVESQLARDVQMIGAQRRRLVSDPELASGYGHRRQARLVGDHAALEQGVEESVRRRCIE